MTAARSQAGCRMLTGSRDGIHPGAPVHGLVAGCARGLCERRYTRGGDRGTPQSRLGDGRVYYNSLGHREDVWTNPLFRNMLIGGFSWTMGKVDFDPVTNFAEETPKGNI